MSTFKKEFEERKNELSADINERKVQVADSIESGVKKTKSVFKKLFAFSLIAAIIVGGLYLLWCNWTYSDGTRAGDLIKISKKGYVFKTYEGQLKLGGIDLQNQDEGLSDTWSFSVTDEAIYRQLEQLQGKKVVLRYKQINKAMPWQGDSDYYIYQIEAQ
ncbi:MAG: hypothetical protein AB8G22_08005 [Saprospiraceae bacterium]